MREIDRPEHLEEVARILSQKPALRAWYRDAYGRFAACLARCPAKGLAVELGSGGGFAQEVVPGLLTTDLQPSAGVRLAAAAAALPFVDGSVRFIGMLNVFHHLPDVAACLAEVQRVLCPGGRVLIVDQHVGPLSRILFRHCHAEPFDPDAAGWSFDPTGPRSGANGALAHIVFRRDVALFVERFPTLHLVGHRPHSPIRYWLAGGLRRWSLSPPGGRALIAALDHRIGRLAPWACSFVDVELLRATGG